MSELSLIFRVGTMLCALPLGEVVELMRPLPIQPLAGSPHYVRGVSVVRGTAVPVLDLGRLLGDFDTAAERFISTKAGGVLAIGAVVGVRDVRPEPGRETPSMGGVVAAVGVLDAEPLMFLDPDGVTRTVAAYAG
ncbi:chemotaxis protein CheW [Catenuloplanes atrovinosus]|uniref:Purine-binding chemotaxis protein CheW n=1 Tax=Catenuloplanes atrovinosus TaxID=137266 RepID=A0AAE3YPH6_9ACTN|nr:chemotaxis protein CheW [Catenuloplanes atrovinosus]MDR7276250.1 purine-binding chemotaxis protein CheW [Catenuloplanes atrovinosus]